MPRVIPYALLRPGQGAAGQLAELRGLAAQRQWTLLSPETDDTGEGSPALRPGLARVLKALAQERADGVLAVSRIAFSPYDDEYECVLDQVHRTPGFLALVRAETSL
ncbi:hypothetical protein ACIBEA_39710 [Streptomyces sp. NPDC051555]|uniref:hypothetical protein n=1 Tax=Streptomyces sp. NPDC051555 TaxID=3365657 RepID=UPI00378ED7AF